jgi:hypothetical protein
MLPAIRTRPYFQYLLILQCHYRCLHLHKQRYTIFAVFMICQFVVMVSTVFQPQVQQNNRGMMSWMWHTFVDADDGAALSMQEALLAAQGIACAPLDQIGLCLHLHGVAISLRHSPEQPMVSLGFFSSREFDFIFFLLLFQFLHGFTVLSISSSWRCSSCCYYPVLAILSPAF